MNIFSLFAQKMDDQLQALVAAGKVPEGLDASRATIELPRDPEHGDLASNMAMVLAKLAGMPPRQMAEFLVAGIQQDPSVISAEIAGPGFINLRLSAAFWQDLARQVLSADTAYGHAMQKQTAPINLEYVSANPTGPMHVGHARGAVVGDVLASLLDAAGYSVTKEYYINDAGSQVTTLARSALLRMREALGEEIGEIPEGLYPGDYLVPVGQALASTYGADLFSRDEADQLACAKALALPMMMEMIKDDLASLGVAHDHFLSEQSLHDSGAVADVVAMLDQKGLVYRGKLDPPKGIEPPEDWEAEEQVLFRSTDFGDDTDRALQKADGSWTYFAPDIACHFNKYERGFRDMINIWGADHAGYIKRMVSAVTAISDHQAQLEVKVCQMVKLQRDGQPVKMSKRAGEFITLREVVDEVGRDVVRFMMLTRKNDAPLDFDFNLVKEKSRDNPVFYVQYAYARICSIFRNAAEAGWSPDQLITTALAAADLSALDQPHDVDLLRLVAHYPKVIDAAAETREPHRLAFFAQEMAAAFHSVWNLGKEDPSARFLQDDTARTQARLALARCVQITLGNCLRLMGVEPQDEMR